VTVKKGGSGSGSSRNKYAVRRNKSPEQLPQRGNIIVENTANKEKAPELLILISVTTVSSGAK